MYVVAKNPGIAQVRDAIQERRASTTIFVFVSLIFWLWGCKTAQ